MQMEVNIINIKLTTTMETVKKLKEQVNALNAKIYGIEKGIKDENEVKLFEEICNLLDGVGKGFTEGDYYAPTRYYSTIKGVKNIRIEGPLDEPSVAVKIVSPVGKLLPESITVRDKLYKVNWFYSDKYEDAVDY